MYALHIFTFAFAVAVFLFVDALPYEQPKVHTIPLKMKSIARRRAYKLDPVSKRAIAYLTLSQDPPDAAYFGEVTFGTGTPQTFQLMFDTGSADLFVMNSDCKSPACKNKIKYDSNRDQSYQEVERPFYIKYGDNGDVKGSSGTTIIAIGVLMMGAQPFGLAEEVSDDFADNTFAGIMGLGFGRTSDNAQTSPITNLINNDALDSPQFSFMLGRDADDTPSELTIGGSDLARYNYDSLSWTNLVNNNGRWVIPVDDCIVIGQSLGLQGRVGLITTGTTRIILPSADADTFYGKISGSKAQGDGTYSIPCDNDNMVIGLRFSGVTWNMDVRDFVIQRGAGVCIGSVEGGDTASDKEWHIGVAFLKNVYSIFDQGSFRIGFAPLKHD